MIDDFFITTNLKQTQETALSFAKDLKAGSRVCLYGDLGSGKTSFVQGIAKGLGIKKRIISPTFIIVKKYKIKNLNFYHIDLYRIESKKDLLGLGIDEILNDNNNIVAIEWAEKLGHLMPEKRTDLSFNYVDLSTRKIEIKSYE